MHTTVVSLFFLVCLFVFFQIVTEFKKYIRINSPKSNHVKKSNPSSGRCIDPKSHNASGTSMSSCRTGHQAQFQLITLLGTLRKSRQRRQREHGETKNLMSKTIAQHVRFKMFIHNVLLARKFRQRFNLVFILKLTPHPYVMLQGRYHTIKNG